MNFASKAVSAAALCALASISTGALAQVPVKPHQAKAPPASSLRESAVVTTFTSSAPAAVAPKKPLVVTAVVPHTPTPPGSGHSIIFVGGKAQSGGNSSLNPQPIPPGHVGPGDPVR